MHGKLYDRYFFFAAVADEISEFVRRYNHLYETKGAGELVKQLYTEDVTLMAPGAPFVCGKESKNDICSFLHRFSDILVLIKQGMMLKVTAQDHMLACSLAHTI